LWGYVSKYKFLMILGLILNVFGMVGEFASPWFIGAVIDKIANNDFGGVS
jgi:ABC-type multidrug transport system fused ATPase/permease subunit